MVLTDLIIGIGANNTGFALNITELVCIITISFIVQILGFMGVRRNCGRLKEGRGGGGEEGLKLFLFLFFSLPWVLV